MQYRGSLAVNEGLSESLLVPASTQTSTLTSTNTVATTPWGLLEWNHHPQSHRQCVSNVCKAFAALSRCQEMKSSRYLTHDTAIKIVEGNWDSVVGLLHDIHCYYDGEIVTYDASVYPYLGSRSKPSSNTAMSAGAEPITNWPGRSSQVSLAGSDKVDDFVDVDTGVVERSNSLSVAGLPVDVREWQQKGSLDLFPSTVAYPEHANGPPKLPTLGTYIVYVS